MAYQTSITLVDGASPVAQDLISYTPEKTARIITRGLGELFMDRFQELENSRPNKLGAPRVHFWSRMRNATTSQARGDRVAIIVNAIGLGLRIHGGTIKPKGVNKLTGKPLQFLTIPTILGYGKRAGENKNQKLKPMRVNGRPALVLDTPDAKTNPQVYYWLARQATIHKDPTILPTQEAIRQRSIYEIRKQLALDAKRAAAARQSQP